MARAGVWTKLFRRAHRTQADDTAGENTTSEQPGPIDLDVLPNRQRWNLRTSPPARTCLKIARAPWAGAEDLPNHDDWQEYLKTINPDRASNIDLRFYMTLGSLMKSFMPQAAWNARL
jgi:hypothetical protein